MKAFTFITLVLSSLSAFASDKARDWQAGRLVDSQLFTGAGEEVEAYTIETETHVYVARRLKWRWAHPPNLAVGGSVKFSIEKNSLYLLDDVGEKHKMRLVETSLK
jgi:hypothetical protein